MRILITGTGAMASLFGARLAPHADVVLAGRWQAQLEALAAGPLRVIETDGRETHRALRAVHPDQLDGTVDAALILTKAPRTPEAAAIAAAHLTPGGVAITLQNGLGNREILAEALGDGQAVQGVTTQGAAMIEPGVVRVGGQGTTTLSANPRIEPLADLFNRAGLRTVIEDNVERIVWRKLAVNAAINPLAALLRVPNGDLLRSENTRHLMREAADEVGETAAALGIAVGDVRGLPEQVARDTAPNRASMLQDVERGAQSEIEAINGAVVKRADRAGVHVPVNAMLYRLVRALEEMRSD
ncbi:MAG: 2-dehydropantoate 2-reductase [Chloroflexi bacterium]|nr:2-dehydropantoate 2-reductase [Chloroflexota bacterium]